MLEMLSNPLFYGGEYDLTNALKFAMSFLEDHTVVMVVSDFIGLKEGWEKALQFASVKFDVIGVMVRDPADMMMPEDTHQILFGDAVSGSQLSVIPDSIKGKYAAFTKNEVRLVKNTFLRSNCDFMHLSTDTPFIDEVIGFFKRREKRVL
jgi:hypothetical protein